MLEGCDVQGNLYCKTFGMRGLGEVAFARGNFALASHCFVDMRSLCAEMRVPHRKLYSCHPLYNLPERFEGRASFSEGWPSFANAI